MNLITKRSTVSELSQQILDMAKTGVYRESVFEALQPLATKKQIREAIAHAKRFGLHSVANLRDEELGTYYQLDVTKYRSLEHAIHSPENLGKDGELVQRLTSTTQLVRRMLILSKTIAFFLIVGSLGLWTIGQGQLSFALLSSGFGAIVVWMMQNAIVQKDSRL